MELPDTHGRLLEQLRDGDSDDIDSDTLADLRRWGMVMPRSLELRGMGQPYAGIGRGVLE